MMRCIFCLATFLLCLATTTASSADPLRLLAFGDSGTGKKPQKQLADVMAKHCQERGCDAALLLGDNIYPNGAISATDQQFKTKFEEPYAALDFPFYVALGNHDIHLGNAGREAQIQYSQYSQKWRMPAAYYQAELGPAQIFVIDTNLFLSDSNQQQWLKDALAASKSPWKIIIGHHPIFSVGRHGALDSGKQGKQTLLREWLSPILCAQQAIYLSAHEHIMQINQLPCGALSVVSGAAASPRGAIGALVNAQRDTLRFYHADQMGFTRLDLDDKAIKISFWGESGEHLYDQVLSAATQQ